MSSSDDEPEVVPKSVSNYHLQNEVEEMVSFCVLPIEWSRSERVSGEEKHVDLRGSVDNGLLPIFKPVKAWKFELSNVKPEIWLLLSKENSWVKLEKPRKAYEVTIRTIMVTVHCLHVVKRNPEIPERSLWDQLSRVFSFCDVRPSQNDLLEHIPLVSEAVKRDETLAKSKFLPAFLEGKSSKRKLSDEDAKTLANPAFIVDDADDSGIDGTEDDECNEEDDLFDSVCSFCDNGGDLLCCDGSCMRSFHPTIEAGEESLCVSLGYLEKEVKEMKNFVCKNCKFNQHQCFACGKLGSSDRSLGAEVFRCANATCGRFYHPHCVAKLLYRDDEVALEEQKSKIAAGEFFACPVHKCCVCKGGEEKKVFDLQFAVCRRCPKSYHRKCLPRKIAFEDVEEESIMTRAWDGLIPNRVLIYCLKHEIVADIRTPTRDHIRFPDDKEKRRITVEEKKKNRASEFPKVISKKRNHATQASFEDGTAVKAPRLVTPAPKDRQTTKKTGKVSSAVDSSRKVKPPISKKSLRDKDVSVETDKLSADDESSTSLGAKLFDLVTKRTEQPKVGKQTPDSASNRTKPATKKFSEVPALDADGERRLLSLIEEASSSITLEDIIEKHKVPSTHTNSSKYVVDKNITIGKVEGSVEAVRMALNKLEEGGSIDDAKAVCEPQIVNQIFKWKNKLKVYLSPFLYGMRYTSFGRHFTKVEKLEEVVDKLHWYVENGDMVVDFCCGANDFSCLMKKKLEETGKTCSYKNYDFIRPKNDFNFEKRDWMTVFPKELPSGSQLIMGLNPPFGVKAALANKFIDKALEFKPKLLILIVPRETQRLDEKKSPYDLVWEDDRFLSGKSFYLPGSVDVNDNQMDQWNVRPPLLYLWSRPDWTAKHKDIAEKHGHVSRQQEGSFLEGDCREAQIFDHPVEDRGQCDDNPLLVDMECSDSEEFRNGAIARNGGKESFQNDGAGRESQESHGSWKNQASETSRSGGRKNHAGGIGNLSADSTPAGELHRGMSHHSSPSIIDTRSSFGGFQDKSFEMPSNGGVRENSYQNFEPSLHGSHVPYDYGRDPNSSRYGTYIGGDRRESEMSSNFFLYGQDRDIPYQGDYLAGRNTAHGQIGYSNYGNIGSAGEPSYGKHMSAMQRYAPRLDEMNPVRASGLGPELSMVGRYGPYDPRPPRPGSQYDSTGFAPGPRRPFSHHGSAGWLNE